MKKLQDQLKRDHDETLQQLQNEKEANSSLKSDLESLSTDVDSKSLNNKQMQTLIEELKIQLEEAEYEQQNSE